MKSLGAIFLLVFLPAQCALFAAPPPSSVAQPPVPPLANASLAPALKAAAAHDKIKIHNLDQLGGDPHDGDATVAWIGATDGKITRQWLIQFRRGTATPNEQKSERKRDVTKYLSWGPVVTFKSEVEALDLWIAGPVVVTPESTEPAQPAPVKRMRVFVPTDYLRLGLDDSLRVDEHLRQRFPALQQEDPKFNLGNIYVLDSPINPKNINHAKSVAEKIGFTPEMARAWCGGFVALKAFNDLANNVPELYAIASVAIDKPSVWKLAKLATGSPLITCLGGEMTFRIEPGKRGLLPVKTESFDAPFEFQFAGDTIVSGRMAVTAPVPPLDTTAGILGLVAVNPKDMKRMVHILIISAEREQPPKPTGVEKPEGRDLTK